VKAFTFGVVFDLASGTAIIDSHRKTDLRNSRQLESVAQPPFEGIQSFGRGEIEACRLSFFSIVRWMRKASAAAKKWARVVRFADLKVD
jgi:hypothetical protein